mmetsp:Transcript_33899/g.41860  ORF Transcript_33899/g.41860 Transcript_33899/m.41860 type:complete len:112 (+) Transcript_33899:425-760(+)|eukprot:CAMPEP_0170473520 /NCGR_PEP_ID=MMETSP0123-20130129/15426_1 /TAXON_ID=182087 /ORGANISM="Favella ehrenbergii, Strain Fehren 1" /LENGTH=111 /DNA_ID=CAMNT_0010742623 /DNA_START=57 /DNA_END=392 /DNA_ORIENTATION=-
MRSFWKEYSSKTLEEYLIEAIHFKYDYCLSFKEIPNEEFESKHRKQFAYEFSLLYHSEINVRRDHAEEEVGFDDAIPYGRRIQMEEISSDSDDIFNDKVTDKIDELNKKSE